MIYFFPFPFLIGLGILLIIIFLLWKEKHRLSYLFAAFLFGIYLLLLIDAVLFYERPIIIGPGPVVTLQNIRHTLSRVNLMPLRFGTHLSPHYLFTQIFYNIMLTVPIGFGINFFAPIRTKKIVWIAAAAGCATELSQLLVSLFIVGGPYRGVDINDVILNMAGVWLGYGVFRLAVRLWPTLQRLTNPDKF